MIKDKRVCPQCSSKSRSDYTRFFVKKYVNELNLNNEIIDLGCGKGRNIYYLDKIGFKNITAIDINTYSQIDIQKFKFVQADLNKGIPLKNTYDIILCNFLLMFIDDRKKLINEIARISSEKAFCVVELNKKDLSNGLKYDFKEIITLFSAQFDIVNLRSRQNKFIAKRRI